jgi:lipoprotein-anchoring transpeptidase ErfK/SrfK
MWVVNVGHGMIGRFRLFGWLIGWASLCVASSAFGEVVVRVDLSEQRMSVSRDGEPYANWAISSGKAGYSTPIGTYRPTVMQRMHRSSKYNNAPMPYSIFFRGGYAIHGTSATGRLGRRASHGCIRLSTPNAATLYNLVKAEGATNTRIVIAR